jgi:aminoglycoside phosphotransferase (APT) family kinase protein
MIPSEDMEPACARLIAGRRKRRREGPYSARNTEEVKDTLGRYFSDKRPDARVSGVSRMGGGASKEQFIFTLEQASGVGQRYVLRMDPREGITETDRRREHDVLRAVQGVVPAPKPVWLDEYGESFGQPAVIMEFVAGVTKPAVASARATGVGTWLGSPLREKMGPQFLKHLASLHSLDWKGAKLSSFDAPTADRRQAARWTLNYWRALWELDKVEERPIMSLAEQWLINNMPDCEELVMIHGDYRTGNYLFDEASGKITAVLDWELARIGDFHEDLAYSLVQVFGTWENGLFRASDLYSREEFIRGYEAVSGRIVNRKTLHYYDILSAYKIYVVVAASGLSAARAAHSHQDVLLSFVGSIGPMFANDMHRLLTMEGSS